MSGERFDEWRVNEWRVKVKKKQERGNRNPEKHSGV
jgi:hypothetical protein